jgi:hypothetical protein
MTEPVTVRKVTPAGNRTTKVAVEGTTCAKCHRPFRKGDRATIEKGRLVHPRNIPCIPAWERTP